ncbi:hypothetical protein pb186bvf_008761 [Paramecium bursaria]
MNKAQKLQQHDEMEIPETVMHTQSRSDLSISMQSYHNDQTKFGFSVIPSKVIAMTAMLLLVGSTFLIFGIILLIQSPGKYQRSLSMIILGVLMVIPGAYYTILLFKFRQAHNQAEQRQILNEFPLD